MRSLKLAVVGVVAAGAVIGFATVPAGAGPDRTEFTYHVGLNAQKEVPGPGEQSASGRATISVDTASGEICWEVTTRNLDTDVTAAHIHVGDRNTAGGVVQGITATTNGTSAGCVVNVALAQAIAADPSNYYVNVHSVPGFAAGAIRGQLAGPRS